MEAEARRVEHGTQMSARQASPEPPSEKDILSEKQLEEEDEALEAEIVMS